MISPLSDSISPLARPATVGNKVFEAMRQAIIQLQLRPGDPLSEAEMARQFGVSRQPVREAFIKLAEVGLVEVRPQRGTFVVMISAREVRIDPLVSVSLRSDGSIDEVTILRSSGRPDMDEAAHRFVRLNARYSAFPPNVAARFDVIEIRRVWAFADGLKLMEEMR